MSRINMAKVIQGGLWAGLIMIIGEYFLSYWVLGPHWKMVLESHNMPPMAPAVIGLFVVMLLVLGIVMIWLYAAISPRYGLGHRTALRAGLLVWFTVWFWGYTVPTVMGLLPAGIAVIAINWGFVEVLLAALAGAWLYKDKGEINSNNSADQEL